MEGDCIESMIERKRGYENDIPARVDAVSQALLLGFFLETRRPRSQFP